MEYHPGVFINKWTCCDGKDKCTQGCKESFTAQERNGYQGGAVILLNESSVLNIPPCLPAIKTSRIFTKGLLNNIGPVINFSKLLIL